MKMNIVENIVSRVLKSFFPSFQKQEEMSAERMPEEIITKELDSLWGLQKKKKRILKLFMNLGRRRTMEQGLRRCRRMNWTAYGKCREKGRKGCAAKGSAGKAFPSLLQKCKTASLKRS